MDKIGVGAQSIRCMVNFMVCTWTIHSINMINGQKKNIGIYNPGKMEGPIVQSIV